MADLYDLLDEDDIAADTVKSFYHALLKQYVALVGSPFVLQRLSLRLYKRHGFEFYLDFETFQELCLELLDSSPTLPL